MIRGFRIIIMKNYAHSIVDIIFKNIKIIILLFIFLASFGTATFLSIEKQGFPEITVNIALIKAPYPTATAKQVEEGVTKSIESALKEIEKIESFETASMDNFAMTTVTIDAKADPEKVIAEITDKITALQLPEGAKIPEVNKFDVAGIGDFVIAVTGPEDVWDLYLASEQTKTQLESVEGIKEIEFLNPLTPQVAVIFDNTELQNRGITRNQVEKSLELVGFNAPAGTIKTETGIESNISVENKVDTIQLLRALKITDETKLEDIADVRIELNNHEKYNRIGTRIEGIDALEIERAVLISIKSDKDADLLETESNLKEKLEEIRTSEKLQSNAEIVEIYSMADSTRRQIEEIQSSLFGKNIESYGSLGFVGYAFGGLSLVVILLFLFMNARVAIMTALAIPLSLFTTTIYLSYMGIGLNTPVLFSMVLVIGLVVDPTIVFLESMQRFKEQGYTGKEAAVRTVSSVGLGITLAVTTNILVFVPFGIVSGFFGEIIKYIPLTVIPAMLASLVIPVLFFMPLAAKVIKPKNNIDESIDSELVGTWKLSRKLGDAVTWTLKKGSKFAALRVLIVIVAIASPFMLGQSLIGSGAIKVVQFSSPEDTEMLMITGEINKESSFDQSISETIVPLQNYLTTQPELKDFSYIMQEGSSFMMLLNLTDISTREENKERKATELATEMNDDIDALNLNADIFVAADGGGPPKSQQKIKAQIKGEDETLLKAAATDIKAFLETLEGTEKIEDNMSSSSNNSAMTLELMNDNKLTRNPLLAYVKIKDALAENELGNITLDNQSFELISRQSNPPVTTEELNDLIIMKAPENLPPGVEMKDTRLGALVAETTINEQETIRRIDGKRYIEVSALIKEDADARLLQNDLDNYLSEEKLEELGLDKNAVSFKGDADSITESFTELFISLGIAIFLIYILLVAFFKSYLEPFIILFAIPLGLIGVFLAVVATTGQLGFLELIGVAAMAGIVVNVTILLIDSANQLQRKGKNQYEAIAMAVSIRFRPIILTQMTAFASLIPLIILSPFWKGLAAVIVMGIITSALVSMFITPILYVWSIRVGKWPGKMLELTKNIKTVVATLKSKVVIENKNK